jgi:glycosyltransferase involved in cell wall biosynthesis
LNIKVKKMSDLVSVVMPSYNTGRYIAETINSVLAQTFCSWELLIVDDCSTDDTDEVVKPYLTDRRIIYLKNEKNSGAAVSRNRALREAKGKWIAFLDSDDLWMPDKLEKQIQFMKNNGYHFSYTNYAEIDVDGKRNGITVTGPKRITKTGMNNYCWPGCLTVMYDRNVVGLIQIADIKKNNDYAMWLKVCQKADCYLLDEELALYRRGRTGSVSTHSIKTMIGWHYRLYREAEGQNTIAAVFNTGRNLVFGFYKKKRYVAR